MSPSAATFPFFADYWLEFVFGGERFRLAGTYANNPLSAMDAEGVFLRPPQLWRQASGMWRPVEAETEWTDTLAWSIAWSGIRTSSENFPNPGQLVELLSIGAHWDSSSAPAHESDNGRVSARDEAIFPAGTLVRVPGATSLVVVSTPHPVRFSNGEATTFHWPIKVQNGLGSAVDLAIRVEAPSNLQPSAPGAIHLEAGETKPVQVYVTVPFAHQHGNDVMINVHFEGGGQHVSYPLQIHYPEIPQPAGHHPVLYFHGEVSNEGAGTTVGGEGWMNPKMDDPDGTATILTKTPTLCPDGAASSGAWWFPLRPNLRIGLDADPTKEGLFTGIMEEQRVRPPGVLYSSLELWDAAEMDGWNEAFQPDQWTASIEFEGTTQSSLTPFEIPILIRPELDRVEPSTQKNLALRLVYCVDESVPTANAGIFSTGGIQAGASMELPLHEFHDVLAIQGAQLVKMATEKPGIRAPSGSFVTWSIDVDVPEQHRVKIYPIGSAVQQVEFRGPNEVVGTQVVEIGMQVPSDARTGDLLEFVMVAEGLTDPAVSGGIRLSVTVDQNAPAINGELSDEVKKSPLGIEALVGLLAMLAVAIRRVRREM